MRNGSLPLAVLSLVAPACFSPDSPPDGGGAPAPTTGSSSPDGEGETDHAGDTSAGPGGDDTSVGGTDASESGEASEAGESDESGDADTSDGPDESGDSTGAPAPVCGDGHVDDGEECDDGGDNGPTGACLDGCVANVCGDGFDGPDEECDDGDDNGPTAGCLDACVVNVCGDGFDGPDEACDDGAGNALEIGACAPDCSTVIETREIVTGSFPGGDLGDNAVALLDAQCPVGYAAMFAVAGQREVTDTPWAADNVTDWPLQPFTAYVTSSGTLMWITDELPLLGVRDGMPVALEQNLLPPCPSGTCFALYMVSGLENDWTTATTNTCNGWTSDDPASSTPYGNASATTDFLVGDYTTSCEGASNARIFCVEQ